MDIGTVSSPGDVIKCCDCECNCNLNNGFPGSWIRSVKRKYDELESENRFHVPGLDLDLFSNARVQIENECELLRETVSSQQQAIQDLYTELEEERNAASTAANEAMSMILRLQREKAEIQMEARQFKRFTEEKMEHDQQELLALEDLVYNREQTIQALQCEVQAYKHRMMSFGLSEAEADGEKNLLSSNSSMVDIDTQYELRTYEYPPLKCNLNENAGPLDDDTDIADVEYYPLAESPWGGEHLNSLERRISQIERNPSFTQLNGGSSSGGRGVIEKVVVGQAPRHPRHFKRISVDNSSSPLGTTGELRPDLFFDSPRSDNDSFKKVQDVSYTEDNTVAKGNDDSSEIVDDMNDRIYTIDSVHNGVSHGEAGIERNSPRGQVNQHDLGDPDIKKLYMRLQALEADRESMRQAIMSMRTEKAQLVLLKEIAQHLSKEVVPERRMPVWKPSAVGVFSFMSIFEWIVSLVFWKKKARRSKYMYGMSSSNNGLLMLLDKGPRTRQWRCLTSTQV
ncbi:PREDICTED: myosin-binding protein 7-like [Tarenaya hassleriana]|uniref:myosin-binding protein 7-like n=1 Tax=Tarenaya hassleriana TaxID=28532 RepID=UPI00053C5A4D|nr:PREDICTED: myosin-binding protein 7-like [Tarenaya hassleriana]